MIYPICFAVIYSEFLVRNVRLQDLMNGSNVVDYEPKFIKTTEDLEKPSHRVWGGWECPQFEYKWSVSLRETKTMTHFCGGSLLTPRWVLTAAYCVIHSEKTPDDITALLGMNPKNSRIQAIPLEKIFINDFYHFNLADDISLVYLSRNVIIYLTSIGFINIPKDVKKLDMNLICKNFTVAGWGHHKQNPVLVCLTMPYLENMACSRMTSTGGKFGMDSEIMCLMGQPGGADACKGDQGSPIFCNGIQWAVVSQKVGCNRPKTPTYAVRLDRHIKFIHKTSMSYPKHIGHWRSSSACFKHDFYVSSIVAFNFLMFINCLSNR